MSLILLSTSKSPVDKSYIDSKLGRDATFDENQEIIRGDVVVLKDGFEEKLSGTFWVYDNMSESFKKKIL